jgi:hypothetical protein
MFEEFRQEGSMNMKSSSKKSLVAMLALAVVTIFISPQGYAAASPDKGATGFTTGLVGIVRGQTARLALWNKGDEAVFTRLQFVDEQGKVLIFCNEIIQPGKVATETFSIADGTSNRLEFQAQYAPGFSGGITPTQAKLIGLLVPTLQVIDDATGANSWMIGPEGFVEVTFGGSL